MAPEEGDDMSSYEVLESSSRELKMGSGKDRRKSRDEVITVDA
jgi:hypothetical protein